MPKEKAVGRPRFQFHKGTIRTCFSYDSAHLVNEFQFHKGTIRTVTVLPLICLKLNFNSIKVRLELSLSGVLHYVKPIFQFHKGTIRTLKRLTSIFSYLLYFNSIKVRLERYFEQQYYLSSEFQFHKGTIRTDGTIASNVAVFTFQFHKGTIRTLCTKPIKSEKCISIP